MPIELLADKMDLPTLGFLLLLIVFPGLVTMRIYRLVAAAKEEIDWRFPLYEPVFWGTINALFAWLIVSPIWGAYGIITGYGWVAINPMVAPIGSFMVLVATAILLPLIWVYLRKKEFIKKYIRQQTPTAWDHYFASRKPCFVLIHLTNGELIGGYFGKDSFATTSPDKISIYIEQVYTVQENGELGDIVPDSKGMLLREDNFEYIEFFEKPGSNVMPNSDVTQKKGR